MHAHELMTPCPRVYPTTPLREAAKLLAHENLPGVIVVDEADQPTHVLSGSEVLAATVPAYLQDNPGLAKTWPETVAHVLEGEMRDRDVAEVILPQMAAATFIHRDGRAIEAAALLARSHAPLIAVIDDTGALCGAITLESLLRTAFAQ